MGSFQSIRESLRLENPSKIESNHSPSLPRPPLPHSPSATSTKPLNPSRDRDSTTFGGEPLVQLGPKASFILCYSYISLGGSSQFGRVPAVSGWRIECVCNVQATWATTLSLFKSLCFDNYIRFFYCFIF